MFVVNIVHVMLRFLGVFNLADTGPTNRHVRRHSIPYLWFVESRNLIARFGTVAFGVKPSKLFPLLHRHTLALPCSALLPTSRPDYEILTDSC
jgi:hypothetical protein